MLLELVTLQFIVFTTLDGRDIHVNMAHIVSVSETKEKKELITDKANCVIGLLDHKLVSVVETCDEVRRRLEELKR